MSGNDVAVLLGFLAAAVALAGFAGIVTSIDRAAAVASNEVISFRVGHLVRSAVASVVLALLPVLFDAFDCFHEKLWTRCCIASALGIAVILASLVTVRLRMRREGKDAGLSRTLFAANITLGTISLGVVIAGAFGVVVGRGAYFTGSFYLLYLMCTVFHRMVAMADAAARNASQLRSALRANDR